MLDTLFSFSGRIGRLDYLKGSFALVGVCLVAVLPFIGLVGPLREGRTSALVMLIVLGVLAFAVILWASLALQVKRCRDIGWPPLVVIPIWIATQVADPLVAWLIPALAFGEEHRQTAIGGLINLFFCLAFLFWPGASRDAAPPRAAPRDRLTFMRGGPSTPPRPPRPPLPSGKPAFGRR